MKIIIDSSTLISLAKINGLDLLKDVNAELICPEEVYRETVVIGSMKAHPDAILIKGIFDEEVVKKYAVRRTIRLSGLSKTDDIVLSLAKQTRASYLFINDTKLARRGVLEGFDVQGSPDILLRLYEKGAITKSEYENYVRQLFEHYRISRDNMERYLKEGLLKEGTK